MVGRPLQASAGIDNPLGPDAHEPDQFSYLNLSK